MKMTLKKLSLSLFFITVYALQVFSLNISFNGASNKVIRITPDKNTGLSAIYIVKDLGEVNRVIIHNVSGTEIDVKRYSSLGGGYAEQIDFSNENGEISFVPSSGDMGYLLSVDGRTDGFWVVDYASYPLKLRGIKEVEELDCSTTGLKIEGEGGEIAYYTVDGRQKILNRDIEVEYYSLEWDEENIGFVRKPFKKVIESITGTVFLTPPIFCNTTVTVEGDRFLKEWGISQKLESSMLAPVAVSVESSAEQVNIVQPDEGSNLISAGFDSLGGSAPADITFYGYATDGVLHTEWQMASDSEFEYIIYRFNEQDVNYTFTEEGTYYMRFIGSNSDGSCESIGETYTIGIGASELRIPNAFSPNNDGINDVWKVGYRSLLEFKCWIFDSKGIQMYYFDDPASGWDGRYRGKEVNPGVYYYVIQATGADGQKYKRSGDINILNYKKYGDSTGSAEE